MVSSQRLYGGGVESGFSEKLLSSKQAFQKIFYPVYLILVTTCKKIASFRDCSASRSCFCHILAKIAPSEIARTRLTQLYAESMKTRSWIISYEMFQIKRQSLLPILLTTLLN